MFPIPGSHGQRFSDRGPFEKQRSFLSNHQMTPTTCRKLSEVKFLKGAVGIPSAFLPQCRDFTRQIQTLPNRSVGGLVIARSSRGWYCLPQFFQLYLNFVPFFPLSLDRIGSVRVSEVVQKLGS